MKKVTYQQIADALGTSRVTVWKAFNNKPGISSDTRNAILAKAVEMGYPLSLTDALQGHVIFQEYLDIQTSPGNVNVAVAVSRPETSNFWMQIIHYQAMALSQNNTNLIYTYLPPVFGPEDTLPDVLTNGTVRGIIVLNVYDERLFDLLNELPIEKVFLDCPAEVDFSSLNGDLFLLEGISSVDTIVEHMISRGKQRIHFIGDIHYAQTNRERYRGYQKAMRRHQLSTEQIPSLTDSIGIDDYRETIFSFLDSLTLQPEAIVCASDYIASLVLEYCREHDLAVPEDLFVSGYDDNPEFNSHVPLTSVRVQNDQLGIRMATRLLQRISHPDRDYEFTYIRNKPVFRASTGD